MLRFEVVCIVASAPYSCNAVSACRESQPMNKGVSGSLEGIRRNSRSHMSENVRAKTPLARSTTALKRRRVPQPWPDDQEFRILAIDGGGIRGVFPATFLAALESRHLGGCSVARYFDLIAGTSTGGIIALGLGARLGADEIRDLYVRRGCEVFPPVGDGVLGRIQRRWRDSRQLFTYRYDRDALERVLSECFGSTKFGDARTRLCIPSVDGRYGETYIFKTPHHPAPDRAARRRRSDRAR